MVGRKEGGLLMRKTDRKYFVAALIMLVLAFTLAMPMPAQAGKVKLNKTKVTISGGRTCQLKVIGGSRKVTWKSSAPKIATVSKAGKVTGKKKGVATITAKVNGKKYTCKVTVTGHKCVWKEHKIKVAPLLCGGCPLVFKRLEDWEKHNWERTWAQLDKGLKGHPEIWDKAPMYGSNHSCVPLYAGKYADYEYCKVCGKRRKSDIEWADMKEIEARLKYWRKIYGSMV